MNNAIVALTPFADWLYNGDLSAPDEPDVRCNVILGDAFTIVFDTLYSPQDMTPILELAGRRHRPVIVVNSHADLDHAWGNAAFPLAPIIGHVECRARLLGDQIAALREKQEEDPAKFGSVVLRPPDITFGETLTIDAGGFDVVLHSLPGHWPDCIMAHIPQFGVLLGGDCVEDPFPLLNTGPLNSWAAGLRAWAARSDVQTVIPSHGPVSGRELMLKNADYLESLAAGRDDGWIAGPDALPFYVAAHPCNVKRARELIAAGL